VEQDHRMRILGRVILAALLVGALAACIAPLSTPGSTSSIALVGSQTVNGWRFDTYRNSAYPCSISGSQTFAIATKVGSSPTATKPLWVFLRGGGVGYFDVGGNPKPSTANKTEESAASLQNRLVSSDVMQLVRNDPAGFRMMSVSMCDHDIYAGPNIADPNNPNTTADGKVRTVNGLFATKAAIQFARALYPTDDAFLHGGSAGSYGAIHVAWALQQQGIAPTGIVADSGVLNQRWEQAMADQQICDAGRDQEALTEVPKRLHPDVANVANQPDLLVSSGRLTVPILHVWSRADNNQCGSVSMACPRADGSIVTLGAADCMHEPLRAVIAAQGPTSRSVNMRLCVDEPSVVGDCDRHVSTSAIGLVNSDPAWPANYNVSVLDWVHARLAD
jgi:hypothetical protein